MASKKETDPYIESFLDFSSRVERGLKKLLLYLLLLLIAVQLLLQFPKVRHVLTRVEQLEGIPYEFVEEPGSPPAVYSR